MRQGLLHRHPVIVITAVLVILAAATYLVYSRVYQANEHNGLVPEAGYRYAAPGANSCQDVSPECGVCYGTVISQQCYVGPSSPYAAK